MGGVVDPATGVAVAGGEGEAVAGGRGEAAGLENNQQEEEHAGRLGRDCPPVAEVTSTAWPGRA